MGVFGRFQLLFGAFSRIVYLGASASDLTSAFCSQTLKPILEDLGLSLSIIFRSHNG
jgi:hypothetical protein